MTVAIVAKQRDWRAREGRDSSITVPLVHY